MQGTGTNSQSCSHSHATAVVWCKENVYTVIMAVLSVNQVACAGRQAVCWCRAGATGRQHRQVHCLRCRRHLLAGVTCACAWCVWHI